MTEPEEKKGALNDRTKILVLIGLILILFGVGYAYDDTTAIVSLFLAYYGLYLLILTLTDRQGIAFPNAYKIVIVLIALFMVWSISTAWIASSYWAGVGPKYGEHVKAIIDALIELLEYLRQLSNNIQFADPHLN